MNVQDTLGWFIKGIVSYVDRRWYSLLETYSLGRLQGWFWKLSNRKISLSVKYFNKGREAKLLYRICNRFFEQKAQVQVISRTTKKADENEETFSLSPTLWTHIHMYEQSATNPVQCLSLMKKLGTLKDVLYEFGWSSFILLIHSSILKIITGIFFIFFCLSRFFEWVPPPSKTMLHAW